MINPLIDKRHLMEYLFYGIMAGIAFIIPVIIFLTHNDYENFYYLFIGSALFMFVILFYCIRLSSRSYDKKRAVSMMIAGHAATFAGVYFSCMFTVISFLFFNPALFSPMHPDKVVENSTPWMQPDKPVELLFIILSVATIANFSVGSFISIVTAYASKVNQTKDKAVPLETHI
jgi:hypothetical protein